MSRSVAASWALVFAGGCASGAATEVVPAPPPERAEPAAERESGRGLAAIVVPFVAEDVAFLAAGELEGRDTPSRGLRIAARFLTSRLERLGFEPGAEGGWFHEWALVERSLDAESASAELELAGETLSLEYGRDYAVHPAELEDAALAGELVWCADASRAAFEGLALSGGIAVAEEGSESRLRRRRRAAEAGAAGLVVLADPAAEQPIEERFATWTARCAEPFARLPGPPDEDPPVFWLAGEPAARLRAAAAGLAPGAELGAHFTAHALAARDVAVQNVCGYWPGRDPALEREVLVLSAHYDHVGVRDGETYCGADDNASGCAALLAVAEALAAHGPLERPVLLLWVSGEEQGLYGSTAWAENPWLPGGGGALANVNLDMVGRNAPGLLEYTPTAAHPAHNALTERLVRLAPLEGFTELKSADKDYARSDHAAFAEHLGIPVLYVSTGEHEDYHQPSDTADKVDADKVARVARLVFRLLLEVAREGV